MKHILIFIFLITAFAGSAQTIELQNHRFGGYPIISSSSRLFLEGGNHVWTNSENFTFPSRCGNESGVSFIGSSLGLLPEGNSVALAWKTASGQTWLASRYLPACTLWPVPCTGGLVKADNLESGGNFQVFNSLTYVAMQNITESIWTCGVAVESGNSVWLASELGLRKLSVLNLTSTQIAKSDVPISFPLTRSKSILGTPFFRNSAYQWISIQNNQAQNLDPQLRFGQPSYTRISDWAVSGNDTVFLADTSVVSQPVFQLFKRSNGTTSRLLGADTLEKLAIQANGTLWLSGAEHGFYFYSSNQLTSIPFFQDKKVEDFVIDSLGQKWILTSASELYRFSDIDPKIQSDSVVLLCDSATWQFEDVSTSINGPIQSRLWEFGDGQTSTDPSPRHRYEKEGLYRVSLTATDEAGSVAKTDVTVLVVGQWYVKIENPSPQTTCQPIRLSAYGTGHFHWTLPDGNTDTSFAVLATQSGWYVATSTNTYCEVKDSVEVRMESQPSQVELEIRTASGQLLSSHSGVFLPIQLSGNPVQLEQVCRAEWKLDGNRIESDTVFPVPFFVSSEGTHVLEMNGLTYQGCPVEGRKEFTIANPSIPNLITANGDGKNDQFEIMGTTIDQLTLFNRWGKEVLKASPYQNDWPPADLEPGIYFYKLTAANQVFSGWVDVVK